MQVGDLVRNVVHRGALGIVMNRSSTLPEVRVRWLNNSWGEMWTLTQNVEVIDECIPENS